MSDALIPVSSAAGVSLTLLYNVDAELVTVGGAPALRERGQIAGAAATEIARVMNTAPAGSEMGLVVRLASLNPGTTGTSLGKAVGATAGANDTGIAGLLVRTDTLVTLTPTDGQYTYGRTDSLGSQWVTLSHMVQAIGSVAHDSPDTQPPVKIGGFASAALRTAVTESDRVDGSWDLQGQLRVLPQGAVAHDAADAGNPIKVGGVANAALFTAVTEGDRVNASFDLQGQARVLSNGTVAHDGVDSGNPVKIGLRALAHGTNPTAVAAADRTDWLASRAGIPWVIGGHPNVVTIEAAYTAAQTDTAIVTIGAGLKIVVTQAALICANTNTVDVAARVGFGTANTPTTTGVVLTHPGIPAGSGYSRGDGAGILGIGADNEDLRITCGVPTTGSVRVLVSYYTVES